MNISFLQTNSWVDRLEASGFRITAPRRAVIDVLIKSSSLLEPMDVFLQARTSCPGLGLVTVYRTLEKLEQLKLIQRAHNNDGCHAYIATREGHHHLLVCTHCHKVEYFSGDDLTTLMKSLGSQRGYKIIDHWLQVTGLCSICKAESSQEVNNEK